MRLFLCSALTIYCTFFPARSRAQSQSDDASAAILGQIIGDDVSVVGPSSAVANAATPTIQFSTGSTIIVHSGRARIDFASGGELEICGPAKFTILSTDQALTVALSFGRVRARFDALRPIAIYTPAILATPLSIGDRGRDATIGLTDTGAMCVLAASGAVRLQNQLSGETTIVPEPREVAVPSASLGRLPAAVGQCRCDFGETLAKRVTPTVPSIPSAAAIAPNRTVTTPAPQSSVPQAPGRAANRASMPVEEVSSPAQTSKPLVVKNPQIQPAAPPVSLKSTGATQTAPKISLPPIGYDEKSDTVTTEPLSDATLMLAQQTVVEPDWIFHGTVVDSGKKQNGTTQSPSTPARTEKSANASITKKPGFWAKFRDFFIGHHKKNCEGVGCG